MTKKKSPEDDAGKKQPKRYPSRQKTKYIALPESLYNVLKQYAEQHSEEGEKRSVSWAARAAVRKLGKDSGLLP